MVGLGCCLACHEGDSTTCYKTIILVNLRKLRFLQTLTRQAADARRSPRPPAAYTMEATKGKRIFKMSPIHHHFELLGWQEVTVVIRFWIICGLCVAIGVGIFYAEWVVGQ